MTIEEMYKRDYHLGMSFENYRKAVLVQRFMYWWLGLSMLTALAWAIAQFIRAIHGQV